MASSRIQSTKNYRLFQRDSGENRVFDLQKHRKLVSSMKLYGFLKCFPIICVRNQHGHLIVKDGQHRLAIAEQLGLAVHWVEADRDFDVAVVNSAAKPWAIRDYADKYAANGKQDYRDGIEFADNHRLPIGIAFALLAGYATFNAVCEKYTSGAFKVRDRKWADSVASTYSAIVNMSPVCRSARMLEACMAACRVEDFDAARLIHGAERCRDKLVSYSTRDAYLDMLEIVYNYNRASRNLFALKMEAIKAMRARSASEVKKSARKSRELELATV